MEEKIKSLWKIIPIKTKLIIIGICLAILLFGLLLLLFLAPLISLGIVSNNPSTNNPSSYIGYTEIGGNNANYWWPIGGSEIESKNGIEYATGQPTTVTITCEYGNSCYAGHSGMDIGNDGYGSNYHNVIASNSGTIITAEDGTADGTGTSYGNYIKIQHDDGKVTVYGHLYNGSLKVKVGDTVNQGQIIAKMGTSGNSTGPHLHFEMRLNGSTVDPLNFVSSSNPRPIVSHANYVEGNDILQTMCLTLKSSGFPNSGIVGILTNAWYESEFDLNAIGDGETSVGLFQWHNTRRDALISAYPDSYTTVESQLEYFQYELKNSYANTYNNMMNESDTSTIKATNFCLDYERPNCKEQTCPNRGSYANGFEYYVNNGCSGTWKKPQRKSFNC